MGHQVLHDLADVERVGEPLELRLRRLGADAVGERRGDRRDLRRRERNAVVGERARGGGRGLELVQPVHAVRGLEHAPPLGERGGVREPPGPRLKEVGVERHHHVGLAEVVDGGDVLPERQPGAGERVVVVHRVVLVPGRLRIRRQQGLDLLRERGRGDGLREHGYALTAVGAGERRGQRLGGVCPALGLTLLRDDLRAVGVVQPQNAGLGRGGGGAERRRVIRVPLELRRASLMALGQDPLGVPSVGDGRREVQRSAWRDLLRLLDVRHDLLLGEGRPRAGRQAGQRHAGPQQLQEVAAVDARGERRRVARELREQELLELVGLGELIESSPVGRAFARCQPLADLRDRHLACVHRWHVEHLGSLSDSMWYAFTNSSPSWSWFVGCW